MTQGDLIKAWEQASACSFFVRLRRSGALGADWWGGRCMHFVI